MKRRIKQWIVCILCFLLIGAQIKNQFVDDSPQAIQITVTNDETGEEEDLLRPSKNQLNDAPISTIQVWSTALQKHLSPKQVSLLAGPATGQNYIEWLQQIRQEEITPPNNKEITTQSLHANIRLCVNLIEKRAEWLMLLHDIASYLSLGFLLLLFGPVLIWNKHKGTTDRVSQTLESIPYFVVSATGLFLLISSLITWLIELQFIQLVLTTFGAPQIVLNTNLILYLHFYPDALGQLMTFANYVEQISVDNPLAAIGIVEQFLSSLNQIHNSPMFNWGLSLVNWGSAFSALYAPFIAGGSFLLLFGIIKPMLKESISYPLQIAYGDLQNDLWEFVTYFVRSLWRELKAFMWSIIYLLFVLMIALVLVHILCLPIAISFVDTFTGLISYLATNEQFPQVSTLAYLSSVACFLVGGLTILMIPLATSIRHTYLITRRKIKESKRFRDYPELMTFYRWLFLSATPRILLAAGIGSSLILLGSFLSSSVILRLWWTSFCIGPLFIFLVWKLKAFPTRQRLFYLQSKPE